MLRHADQLPPRFGPGVVAGDGAGDGAGVGSSETAAVASGGLMLRISLRPPYTSSKTLLPYLWARSSSDWTLGKTGEVWRLFRFQLLT